MLFSNLAFGQFKVIEIKRGTTKIPKADIELRIGSDLYKRSITRATKDLNEKAEIYVKDKGIILELESSNGNKLTINGSHTLKVNISKKKEEYQLISGNKSDNVIIEVIDGFTGSVIATGIKKRFTAAHDGTVFSLSLDGDDLDIVLNEGSLNISHLIKKEISDSSVIDNNRRRSLFIRENIRLTEKDSIIPKNEFSDQTLLTNDRAIEKFLQTPFKDQKRALLNMGPISKMAFKQLENKASTDEAFVSFEKAIENSELELDFLIQSAFLFADTYLYKGDFKKSREWVEIGIKFGTKLFELVEDEEKKLNARMKYNSEESDFLDFNNILTKAFRYDFITANEFQAWGYDIKLKLNGCLENPIENPDQYRKKAKELNDMIE